MKQEIPKSMLIGLAAIAVVAVLLIVVRMGTGADPSQLQPGDYEHTPQQMQKLKLLQEGKAKP